jgi:hypothetical protein
MLCLLNGPVSKGDPDLSDVLSFAEFFFWPIELLVVLVSDITGVVCAPGGGVIGFWDKTARFLASVFAADGTASFSLSTELTGVL